MTELAKNSNSALQTAISAALIMAIGMVSGALRLLRSTRI